jgi:glycosyltransferase involved in cell wall biosynthesis
VKILFISRLIPKSNGGGSELRAMQHLMNLSKIGIVDLLFVSDSGDCLIERTPDETRSIAKGVFDTAYSFKEGQKNGPFKRIFSSWGNGGIYQKIDDGAIEALRTQIGTLDHDVVFASQLGSARVGLKLFEKNKEKQPYFVCDSDFKDAAHLFEDVYDKFRELKLWEALRLGFNASKVLFVESGVLRKSNLVVCCSQSDQSYFSRLSFGKQVKIIDNWLPVDPGYSLIDSDAMTVPTVMFVGTFSHQPNAIGAKLLVEKIWPKVYENLNGQARLLLIGSKPPEELKSLDKINGIVVTGFVPEVTPFYLQTLVSVCPLVRGTGTSLKLVEAMAYGRVLVGFRNILARPGLDRVVGVVSVNNIEEFVEQLTSLLRNPENAKSLGVSARNSFESLFSQTAVLSQYQECVRT